MTRLTRYRRLCGRRVLFLRNRAGVEFLPVPLSDRGARGGTEGGSHRSIIDAQEAGAKGRSRLRVPKKKARDGGKGRTVSGQKGGKDAGRRGGPLASKPRARVRVIKSGIAEDVTIDKNWTYLKYTLVQAERTLFQAFEALGLPRGLNGARGGQKKLRRYVMRHISMARKFVDRYETRFAHFLLDHPETSRSIKIYLDILRCQNFVYGYRNLLDAVAVFTELFCRYQQSLQSKPSSIAKPPSVPGAEESKPTKSALKKRSSSAASGTRAYDMLVLLRRQLRSLVNNFATAGWTADLQQKLKWSSLMTSNSETSKSEATIEDGATTACWLLLQENETGNEEHSTREFLAAVPKHGCFCLSDRDDPLTLFVYKCEEFCGTWKRLQTTLPPFSAVNKIRRLTEPLLPAETHFETGLGETPLTGLGPSIVSRVLGRRVADLNVSGVLSSCEALLLVCDALKGLARNLTSSESFMGSVAQEGPARQKLSAHCQRLVADWNDGLSNCRAIFLALVCVTEANYLHAVALTKLALDRSTPAGHRSHDASNQGLLFGGSETGKSQWLSYRRSFDFIHSAATTLNRFVETSATSLLHAALNLRRLQSQTQTQTQSQTSTVNERLALGIRVHGDLRRGPFGRQMPLPPLPYFDTVTPFLDIEVLSSFDD